MQSSAVFRIKASELNAKWLRSIKAFFGDKDVEVLVTPATDDTEYLLSSPTNAKILQERITNLNNGGDTIKITADELDKMARDSNAKH